MQCFRNTLFQAGRGTLAIACFIGLGAVTSPVRPSDVVPTETMTNLNAALNGERNTHARYVAFAQKADEEGYGAVASLFRAVAAAEEIHGNNHEQTIQRLGGTPAVKLETPEVKSTYQNLEASLDGESYEWKTMYPQFIAQARREWYVPAIATFEKAQRTEEEHAQMLEGVLKNLDSLKGSSAKTYYVCTICGFTTPDLNFEKCRSCFNPKSKYKAVS
jgi:rubrerythrin